MTATVPTIPAALLALGFIEPLRNTLGVPYASKRLPCTRDPWNWDEDARPRDQTIAAAVCVHHCPALAACTARRDELGPLAHGVWAGVVLAKPSAEQDDRVIYDANVAAMMLKSGTRFSPRRKPRAKAATR